MVEEKKRLNVYIIDDEEMIRNLIAKYLRENHQCNVRAFAQYELAHPNPMIHLYMCDYDIKQPYGAMSGKDWVEANKGLVIPERRVLMNGHFPNKWEEEGIKGTYLSKPFPLASLDSIVKDMHTWEDMMKAIDKHLKINP